MREATDDIRVYEKVFSDDTLRALKRFFEDSDQKTLKPTGPHTLNVGDLFPTSLYREILAPRIRKVTGSEHQIMSGLFFSTPNPHGLHTDGPKEHYPACVSGLLIPIDLEYELNAPSTFPHFYLFHQTFEKFPAKLYWGEQDIYSPYNFPIYDYSEVENLTSEAALHPSLHAEIKGELAHLKPSWLRGLSIKAKIPWRPGDLISFYCHRVHCSGDFRKLGIRRKLGLSLFGKTTVGEF